MMQFMLGVAVGYYLRGKISPVSGLGYLGPRRFGKPLSDIERQKRHYQRYGTYALPPRGTGLSTNI